MVDNPGAGSNVGRGRRGQRRRRQPTTLVLATVGARHQRRAVQQDAYDMVKDFAPVDHIASTPNLLVVTNSIPGQNGARAHHLHEGQPDKLSFGSPGIGTSVHVSGELFKSLTGTKMQRALQGRRFAIPDLVGGQIQLMFDNMPSALPMAKSKIRAGVTSAKPAPQRRTFPRWLRACPASRATSWFRDVRSRRDAGRRGGEAERRDEARVRAARRLGQVEDPGPGSGHQRPEDLARLQAVEIVKWAKRW